jgi:hypothetical protein
VRRLPHTLNYLRGRRRRWSLRALLVALSFGTAYAVHLHDADIYGGYRGSSDPVALVVLVILVTFSIYATSEDRR